MNKLKSIKIEHLLYILMFVPILFFLKSLNNDFYFLYKHGEFVIQNGFPTTEPFTVHYGSEFVMQQWLCAVIYYLIFEHFGKIPLFIFITLIAGLTVYFTYKTFLLISNNKSLSNILTFISSFVMIFYTQTRPFVISYLITIILFYILIKYTKTNNKKILLYLPLISILQINIQCSMWIFLFIMILPFLFEKNIFTYKNLYNENYSKKPLYLFTALMIPAGLLNPYGLNAMLYTFKSIKYNKLLYIYEMSEASLTNIGGILIIVSIIMLCLLMININGTINIRYMFFFWGSIILTFFALRNVPYLSLSFTMLLSDFLKNVDIDSYIEKNKNNVFRKLTILLITTIFAGSYLSITDLYKVETFNAYEGIDLIIENYGIDDNTTIYTDYNDGSYAIYKGFKVYLDARMEVYLDSNNKQQDYVDEYVYVQHGRIPYQDFLDKYKFNYLVLSIQDIMYGMLDNDEDYEKIYENQYCEIFKRKE